MYWHWITTTWNAAAMSVASVVGIYTALGALCVVQIGVARLRAVAPAARRVVDDRPVLLMDGVRMRRAALRREGVTRADLLSRLRKANVPTMDQVHAMVLEATGDISVLHGDVAPAVSPVLLEGVSEVGSDASRIPGGV
jgi:uncharacterized membrane protein YcaP (DUF421 family)